MKICETCNNKKNIKDFLKHKDNIDKLSKSCKVCIDNCKNEKYKTYIYEDKNNYLNKTIDKITVLSFSKRVSENGVVNNYLNVKCECGKIFEVRESNIISGNTRSCGCVRIKHRLTKDPIYSNYNQMMQRCYNKNNKNYNYCGKRGISVYKEWVDSPEKYILWVKENLGPKLSGFSIDRINNDGNYEPGNLRWATRHEQAQNTTLNVICGETACKIYTEYHTSKNKNQSELSRKYNCTKHTIYRIVHGHQWKNYTKNLNITKVS